MIIMLFIKKRILQYLPVLLTLLISSSCSSQPDKKVKEATTATPAVNYSKYNLDKIQLPPGFRISVFAEVPNARSMSQSPSGIVYVGNRGEDKVYAIKDEDGDGVAEKKYVVAKDMDTPNGVAYFGNDLYIATVSSVYILKDIENHLSDPPAPILVTDKFPKDKHHGWKFIAFGPDGKLYVPVGDPSNISDQGNSIYSTIMRMNADGSGLEVFARGIRNTVGFDWHPSTGNLWFTDNGRDQLGDDVLADELNKAGKPGIHFGHPYCLQGNILDPKFGKGKSCDNYQAPVELLGPHVAALGMRFYTGSMFDSSYKNQIFIAEHGSWNRTDPIGYRITTVKLDENGKSLGYSTFAEGWLQNDGKVIGRPVDVLVRPDGSLLVSDDYAGLVYRIYK